MSSQAPCVMRNAKGSSAAWSGSSGCSSTGSRRLSPHAKSDVVKNTEVRNLAFIGHLHLAASAAHWSVSEGHARRVHRDTSVYLLVVFGDEPGGTLLIVTTMEQVREPV